MIDSIDQFTLFNIYLNAFQMNIPQVASELPRRSDSKKLNIFVGLMDCCAVYQKKYIERNLLLCASNK